MLFLHLESVWHFAQSVTVCPVDRERWSRYEEYGDAMARGAGGSIFVGRSGHTVNALPTGGRLLVTPSAVDPLKLFFVRQGRDVRMTFKHPRDLWAESVSSCL